MRKTFISLLLLVAPLAAFSQLKVYRNGNVAIGQATKSGASKLAVGGSIKTSGIIVPFNKEINDNAVLYKKDDKLETLSSLMAMEVVSFSPVTNDNQKEGTIETPSKHYAISPEVLQQLFPTLVTQETDGTYGVNYTGLVPLLVRSIQELQQEVEMLKGMLATQDSQNSQTRGSEPSSANMQNRFSATLKQNTPNPVKEQTTIGYLLSGNFNNASIRICDINGNVVKSYDAQSGTGTITVIASELGSGLFLYSLVVDDNIIDTKKMIVSK